MNSTDQQLLNRLKNLFPEFKCSLLDLRNPTEEFVTNFFSFWLTEFNVDINNVNQVQFAQSNVVQQYHDTFSGIIPKANLLKCMRWFEVIPDFGMLDIISPTPKRTQTIIKNMIEFFQWADDRVCQIQDRREDLNERKNNLSKLLREKENWKEKLNSITKTIATIQDENQKFEAEMQQLQQKLSDLKISKQKAKVLTDELNEKLKEKEIVLQKLKKEEAVQHVKKLRKNTSFTKLYTLIISTLSTQYPLKEQSSASNSTHFHVNSKIKECTFQVVDSPTSILFDVESLQTKSNNLSELLDEKQKTLEIKMQNQKKMENIVVNMKQQLIELKDLLKLIDTYRSSQRKMASTDNEIKDLQDKLEQLKLELITVSTKKRRKQKALEGLHLKWTALKPKLMENLEALIKELDEKKSEKSTMVNGLKEDAAVQEEYDSLLKKIKLFCEKFENDRELFMKMKDQQLENLKSQEFLRMKEIQEEVEKKYKKDD